MTDTNESNIGKILKIRRKGCFLSQKKLAARSYVDKKTISYIESGKTANPHKSTMDLLFAVIEEEENRIKKIKEEVGLID